MARDPFRDFFLDWALRLKIEEHPRSIIHIEDAGEAVMGFVPLEHDGTVMTFKAKPAG
jgi:hypothetical protein